MSQPTYPPPGNQPQDGQYGQPQYGQPQYGQPQYGQPQYASDQQQPPGYYAPAPVTRPAAIDKAVLLMKIGAGLSLLGLLPLLFMRDQMRTAVEQGLRDSNQPVTADNVNMAMNVGMVTALVIGLIGAGLWWWMAVMNGQGKSWARILSTVFFLLSLVLTLPGLVRGGDGSGALGMILSVVSLAVGAGAIFFLWQKESSNYYEAASRQA